MKQNIFSYKNAVFYTHINGCVHECRFKKLLLAIKSLCYWNGKDANLGCGCPGLNIVRMDVSIAGHNGIFGMNDGVFDPNRIYRSIEDCIKDTNPIFYSSGKFLKLDVPLWVDLEREFVPDNASWQNNGEDGYCSLFTYRRNGFTIERTPINGICEEYDNAPLYDLANDKWIVDNNNCSYSRYNNMYVCRFPKVCE